MKVIKTDRRNCLHTTTLDDLMEINVEGPPFESFSAGSYGGKIVHEGQIKLPERRSSADDSSNEPNFEAGHATMTLDAWDDWFLDANPTNSDNILSATLDPLCINVNKFTYYFSCHPLLFHNSSHVT